MPRVLCPELGCWYDELRAVAFYGETDLEDSICQHLASLFPEYNVFPFKKEVTGRGTGVVKKPDLAMLRKDLSAWGIIEVELAGKDIKHVLEQTSVFKDGEYNAPMIAGYMQAQLKKHCRCDVPIVKLTKLLDDNLPSVLVIVDGDEDEWEKELQKIGVDLCVFEIYKNATGAHVYRTSGQYPTVEEHAAHCKPHPSIPNVWEVVGKFPLKTEGGNNEISIALDDRLTRWSVVKDRDKVYLRFLGQMNPLFASSSYNISADKSQRYYFRRN